MKTLIVILSLVALSWSRPASMSSSPSIFYLQDENGDEYDPSEDDPVVADAKAVYLQAVEDAWTARENEQDLGFRYQDEGEGEGRSLYEDSEEDQSMEPPTTSSLRNTYYSSPTFTSRKDSYYDDEEEPKYTSTTY